MTWFRVTDLDVLIFYGAVLIITAVLIWRSERRLLDPEPLAAELIRQAFEYELHAADVEEELQQIIREQRL